MAAVKHPRVFVVSGPSGVGKSSIIKALQLRYPGIRMSASLTTRGMRPGEINGRDYYFVSREEFETGIRKQEFLEWARVYDNYYGTSRAVIEEMLAARTHVLLDLDTQGAMQLQQRCAGIVYVFIAPPSVESLEARLRGRGTESDATLAKRMARASHEISHSGRYDYVIVNDSIARAVERFLGIIVTEEQKPVPFLMKQGGDGPHFNKEPGNFASRSPALTAGLSGLDNRMVSAMADHLDKDRLLQSLESEIRSKLGIEVSGWLRQRMDAILHRDLEGMVREEYRDYVQMRKRG